MTGRPTSYSSETLSKTFEYLQRCIDKKDIPYVEELAIEILGVDDDTLVEWAKEHPEFSAAIKELKTLQKLRLQKGSTIGKYNPSSAIFQLKANHGMIETEKRILSGDQAQPLRVIIEDFME